MIGKLEAVFIWSMTNIVVLPITATLSAVVSEPGDITGLFWWVFAGAAIAGGYTIEEMRRAEPRKGVEEIAWRVVLTVSGGCLIGLGGGETLLPLVVPDVQDLPLGAGFAASLGGLLGEKILAFLWRIASGAR